MIKLTKNRCIQIQLPRNAKRLRLNRATTVHFRAHSGDSQAKHLPQVTSLQCRRACYESRHTWIQKAFETFGNNIFQILKSAKLVVKKAETRAGINGNIIKELTEDEKKQIENVAKQMDEAGKQLLLEFGFTEEELQSNKVLQNPYMTSLVAIQAVSELEALDILDIGQVGACEILSKESWENLGNCIMEATGLKDIKGLLMGVVVHMLREEQQQ